MAEGVPEIEQGADPVLVRVHAHNLDFYGDGGFQEADPVGGGDILQRIALQFQNILPEGHVADQCVFDHFGKAAVQFAGREGFEEIRVDKYGCRAFEYADDIFKALEIDAEFSADGGVGHGQ